MEDEICPYATFHLLGFREEMDPSKALAFPHHHPAHAGTLAHPHPHHPAHSRAGSQSMVSVLKCPTSFDRFGLYDNWNIQMIRLSDS